jgi:ADP-heptose:LPS heptosyltransferase
MTEPVVRLKLRELLLLGALRLVKVLDRRDGSAAAFSPGEVKNILVISSTALGDTVLSTAAMTALRTRYPNAWIVGLVHRAYADLFRRLPALNEVIVYHGGYRRFLRTARDLRARNCDLAVILHGNEPQATPLAYLSGARFIFKLPNTSAFRFLLSNPDPVVRWPELGHGLQQRLRVAALVGADIRNARMVLPVTSEDRRAVDDWLRDQGVTAAVPLIGLQTGASSMSRQWPPEYFAALARRLQNTLPQRRFVLTGTAGEAAYCRAVADAIGPAAIVAAGEFPITLLPTLVGEMQLLVSGDTGTLHVAVAVGTPTVGLFAVSNPVTSGPAYDLDRHPVIYQPCADRAMRSKGDDQTCIRRITVDAVAEAVERLVARGVTS